MKYICSCGKPTDNATTIGSIVIHTCDDCKKEIEKQVAWESMGEQWREETVICPFCGHEYSNYDSWNFEVGETSEVECECCGKRFDLEVREVRNYSTKRSLCEMPEDWDGDSDG